MVESLREVCKQGVHSYANTPREKWVLEWPGQVVLVVTGVYWTREVGEAMASKEKGSLKVSESSQQAKERKVDTGIKYYHLPLKGIMLEAAILLCRFAPMQILPSSITLSAWSAAT